MSDLDSQSDSVATCPDTIPATQPLLSQGTVGANKHLNGSSGFLSVSHNTDSGGYKLIGRDCCRKCRSMRIQINSLPREVLLK